jgi:hypothetical protein
MRLADIASRFDLKPYASAGTSSRQFQKRLDDDRKLRRLVNTIELDLTPCPCLKNTAEAFLSRAAMIVWFNRMAMVMLLGRLANLYYYSGVERPTWINAIQPACHRLRQSSLRRESTDGHGL